MFFAHYEPFLDKYLLYYKDDLYYFSQEEINEFFSKGKIIKNHHCPAGCMSAPLQFQIAITERCNFNCHNCYDRGVHQKTKKQKELSLAQMKKFLDYLYEWGVLLIQWSGGEPFLSKNLKALVEYARSKRFTQTILTNGSLLANNEDLVKWTAKNFERVQISFNAVDRFKDWTGMDKFQMLLNGMFKISKSCVKSKKVFNLTTTIDEISIGELEKIVFWVNEINPTSWRIGEEVPLGMAKKQTQHLEILEESYKIFQELKTYYGNKQNWHHCFEIEETDSFLPIEWQSSPGGKTMLYMSVSGDIYPFPYLKMSEFYLGKYPENDIKTIWFDSQTLKNIRSIRYGDTKCGGCQNVCVRWAREINYHFNKNLKESPLPFTNCPRKEVNYEADY